MTSRRASDHPMDDERANELRDSNDPIYPDVETDQRGRTHVGNHNADPLSGQHGSHPVGSGLGAAAGGTLGGIGLGAAAGPLGAAIGALVGGLAGGLAGKSIAEVIDPTVEDAFWREESCWNDNAVTLGPKARLYRTVCCATPRGTGSWFDSCWLSLGCSTTSCSNCFAI